VAKSETELQMVQRHVREGEAHVQRQREIVTKMRERGAPTDIAVTLLEAFQDTLRQHRAHLGRIEARDDAVAIFGAGSATREIGAPQAIEAAPVRLNPQSPEADYEALPSGTRFIGPMN
jgi:hypothetical protein